MERSVAGARRDAVVTKRRGPRSIRSRAFSRRVTRAAGASSIRTVVVEDHEDIARLVANAHRDADSRTNRGGRAHRPRPRHRLDADRRLPRADPHAPRGGAELRGRRDVQSRRVLPDAEGEHPLLPPLHVGESVLARSTSSRRTSTSRPATCRATEVDDAAQRYELAIERAGGIDFQILGIGKTGHIGFNEPGSGAESRTRLVTLDAVTRRDAAADFFGEENVPREAVTMGVATILDAREIAIIATGEHKASIVQARRRRRHRRRGRRHVPAAAPEHDVLRRSRRGRRADAHQDAVAARRSGVDAGPDRPRGDLAVAAHGQGDPQAHAARLRRRAHVVARRASSARRAR